VVCGGGVCNYDPPSEPALEPWLRVKLADFPNT